MVNNSVSLSKKTVSFNMFTIVLVIVFILQLTNTTNAERKHRFCGNNLNEIIKLICNGKTNSYRTKKASGKF